MKYLAKSKQGFRYQEQYRHIRTRKRKKQDFKDKARVQKKKDMRDIRLIMCLIWYWAIGLLESDNTINKNRTGPKFVQLLKLGYLILGIQERCQRKSRQTKAGGIMQNDYICYIRIKGKFEGTVCLGSFPTSIKLSYSSVPDSWNDYF